MAGIGMGGTVAGLYDPVANLANQLTTGQIQNPAAGTVAGIAGGNQIGQNPYTTAAYNQAAGRLTQNFRDMGAPQMALDASSAGRTGGGLYALLRNQGERNLGNSLSDLATGIYGNAYNTDRANQMNALGLQSQIGQQGVNNQLAGAGLFNQGQQNAFQGIQLGQSLQNQQLANLQAVLGVGTAQQQAPWQAGQQFAATLQGTPGIGGGSQTQNPYFQPSLMSNVIGGGLGGSALGKQLGPQFGGTEAQGSQYGALLGTILGGLGTSDVRVKDDIKRVGETDAGLPLYTYRYKGDPAVRIGPIAQEVLKHQPDAVKQYPGGLLAVDYLKVH